jgi:hypothetical protein
MMIEVLLVIHGRSPSSVKNQQLVHVQGLSLGGPSKLAGRPASIGFPGIVKSN